MAISDDTARNRENPFEYDIDEYKSSGADLLQYRETQQIDLPLRKIVSMTIDAADKIFIAGDAAVFVYSVAGLLHNTFTSNGTASCLATDAMGNIYLGIEDHIDVLDADGVLKAQWPGLGSRAVLTSVAVSTQFVFVADAGHLIVWKYDKSGNLLGEIGERNSAKDIPGFVIPSPYFDIAVDSGGFLWAANTGRHSVENYTPDGDIRTFWGHHSMEIDGFCGCCNPSHIALMQDGSFVTSEKGIPRVKVYDELGELNAVVAMPDQFDERTEGLDLALDSQQRIYVLDAKRKQVRIFEKSVIN
jgi:hypothetical protein